MNRVVNGGRSAANGKDKIYIGRGSPYGNPFKIGVHGNREEVIAKFREMFYAFPEFSKNCEENLQGKTLVCHCAPLPCHGDVIAEYLSRFDQLERLI